MTHEMELAQTYPSGAQEFHCTTCSRQIVVHWGCNHPITVLEPGDENATHHAGLGGLSVCDVGVMDKMMYDFWDEEISKLKGELYES